MPNALDFFISQFRSHLDLSNEPSGYYRPRPYRNASVRFRNCALADFNERRDILINEAGLNTFLFRADKIPGCDLLSDSGTTTMTSEQWAAMIVGDEAYGSNEGYFELKQQVGETFGPDWRQKSGLRVGDREPLFIFHQGRAAENALFTVLSRELKKTGFPKPKPFSSDLLPQLRSRIENRIRAVKGQTVGPFEPFFVVPSNSHFDTTEGNIEDKFMVPLNLPCREHLENNENFPFRGNMDLEALENLLASEPGRVPLVYVTITNNTGGGQPVSMENIKRVREITRRHKVPFFFDACRFAENAWFIREEEKGYGDRRIGDIVREMFDQVDGFHISFKKDGLGNIGGAICLREDGAFTKRFPQFANELTDYQIMTEGHPTYGGLAGRDLKALAEGLRTVTRQDYLNLRVRQMQRFGDRLTMLGIPIVRPIGGHAIYIDIDKFFDGAGRDEELKGISFTSLLLIAGHRFCELGLYAFGSFDGRKEVPPEPRVNNVRAAVPRLTYEDRDLFAAAEAVKILHDHRDRIPGVRVDYGRDLKLRHFKSRFSFIM
ncbi:MAG: tryptophanase [Candidatus Krumholzibacteria bacterium]|nr:tryptophanase [Candidatus Krumholzibacteria bacterium]